MPSSSARRTRTTTIVRVPTLNRRPENRPVDWRLTLPPQGRDRIIMKIMMILKWYCPNTANSRIYEVASIFEGRIFANAVSKLEYVREIARKILPLEMWMRNYSRANAERVAGNRHAANSG